jgi:hypothetical protein
MMDLLCYVPTGWTFKIRPAEAKREWMDRTADAFAYRCLPLNIANAHGWEVLAPSSFEVIWNGGSNRTDLTIRMIGQHEPAYAPVSLFGNGVLTIHMHGLFRTPPGWNLWVSGPPNLPKDGIYPLTGIVEADWSPYTFTMNWQITRSNQWIRFDKGEPVCFFFPVQRGLMEAVEPRVVAFEKNPELLAQFNDWRASRDTFYKNLPAGSSGGDSWQKRYYRGVDMRDRCPITDHETKLRLKPFVAGDEPAHIQPPSRNPGAASSGERTARATAPSGAAADPSAIQRALQMIGVEMMRGADPAPLVQRIVALGAPEAEARRIIEAATSDPLIVEGRKMAMALRERDQVLSGLERQRRLAPSAARIERRTMPDGDEFLERYYSVQRPVVLLDAMSEWPALARWTADYLSGRAGDRTIDVADAVPGEAGKVPTFHEMPFAHFVDRAQRKGPGGHPEMSVFDSSSSARNGEAFALFQTDLGTLDDYLVRSGSSPNRRLRIDSAGAASAMQLGRTNAMIAQIVGRRRFTIVPAGETPCLHPASNDTASSSDIKAYDVILAPGEILFLPLTWWRQVEALEFSAAVTYADFKWASG